MIGADLAADDLPIRPELIGFPAYGAPQLDVAVRLELRQDVRLDGPLVSGVAGLRQLLGLLLFRLRH